MGDLQKNVENLHQNWAYVVERKGNNFQEIEKMLKTFTEEKNLGIFWKNAVVKEI